MGGWVGRTCFGDPDDVSSGHDGWEGLALDGERLRHFVLAEEGEDAVFCVGGVGGWVGGWRRRGGLNELLDIMGGWVGGWVGGWMGLPVVQPALFPCLKRSRAAFASHLDFKKVPPSPHFFVG